MLSLRSKRAPIPAHAHRWSVRPASPLWRRLSPAQAFVASFLLLELLGTVGLKTIPGLYVAEPISWLDALFTTTSAVCVTGLNVIDPATVFTLRGQAFVLLLIQLGGLGIITFTSLIIVAFGRRLSLRDEALSTGAAEVAPHVERSHLLRNIVLFTLSFELIGAVLLYAAWIPKLGWSGAVWPAVFHSVSAFCNAGFSTFSDSLVGSSTNPVVLWTVMALIVLGGAGFLTLEELYLLHKSRRLNQRFRLSLHSRLVIVMTLVLILSGWASFLLLEWNNTLRPMSGFNATNNALFMSVTARTAGFNTIDYGQATIGTNFVTILLMSVGGSPGSTAGGLKTTTVALIVLAAWTRFRGRDAICVAGRSVPPETIQRAIGLFVITFTLMTVGVLTLSIAETEAGRKTDFLRYMFEAVSAFNTVGLSMGATPELTSIDRVMTIALMFTGRVGPLVLADALSRRRIDARRFRYAYEDVVVG